jgi:hypothetical protein
VLLDQVVRRLVVVTTLREVGLGSAVRERSGDDRELLAEAIVLADT